MFQIEFILYVADQIKSRDFYSYLLDQNPTLDVPGMTEFTLGENCKLGLMPENGIAKIISPVMPHPSTGAGIPRCELYLVVPEIKTYWDRISELKAPVISPVSGRDWGHTVGYLADLDGHVIALAQIG